MGWTQLRKRILVSNLIGRRRNNIYVMFWKKKNGHHPLFSSERSSYSDDVLVYIQLGAHFLRFWASVPFYIVFFLLFIVSQKIPQSLSLPLLLPTSLLPLLPLGPLLPPGPFLLIDAIDTKGVILSPLNNINAIGVTRYWSMLIDADWCWLMLIDADWYADWYADWCWLMLIGADWCW